MDDGDDFRFLEEAIAVTDIALFLGLDDVAQAQGDETLAKSLR